MCQQGIDFPASKAKPATEKNKHSKKVSVDSRATTYTFGGGAIGQVKRKRVSSLGCIGRVRKGDGTLFEEEDRGLRQMVKEY